MPVQAGVGDNRPRLLLASTSPRRRLLLPLLGLPVDIASIPIDEVPLAGEPAEATAVRLAEAKARAAWQPGERRVVVGSDTIVALEGEQVGKPVNSDEATRMLQRLRGRQHEVISGVALVGSAGVQRGLVRTLVIMREYSDEEITAYVSSGRPLDKAGAYAIQDRDFKPVEQIEGCYLSVVGLPLCEVSRGLRRLGWPQPDDPYDPPCRWCLLGQIKLESAERPSS